VIVSAYFADGVSSLETRGSGHAPICAATAQTIVALLLRSSIYSARKRVHINEVKDGPSRNASVRAFVALRLRAVRGQTRRRRLRLFDALLGAASFAERAGIGLGARSRWRAE
jgi:hypothetical protein